MQRWSYDDLNIPQLAYSSRCWIWYSTNITFISHSCIFFFVSWILHSCSIDIPLVNGASWEPHHSKALTRAASSIDARHGTSKASRRRPKGTRQPLALTKVSYVSYNYSMMYHDYHDLTWFNMITYIYTHYIWIYFKYNIYYIIYNYILY